MLDRDEENKVNIEYPEFKFHIYIFFKIKTSHASIFYLLSELMWFLLFLF